MNNMMENNFQALNTWEMRKSEIKNQIDSLKKSCLAREEFYSVYNKVEPLDEKREISIGRPEVIELFKRFNSSVIKLETLSEFTYALSLLDLSNELAQEVVAHENAHLNMAQKFNATDLYYGIGFIKLEKTDQEYHAILPFAHHGFPDEKSFFGKEMQRKVETLITKAPEIYGGKLSQSDIDKINHA